mmetsp:Transcript_7769/g.22850  ORF Transcript_7769/g.22850 Transcript_7769/m.22850 type:complete len:500 (+) Transcript_7769:3737-5236(+)
MYVNEVGHNPDLQQNVVSRDNHRSVSYYLLLEEPLEKGQTVELLVHYLDGYEEMRERKGYGKANVKCDKDDYARLQRNLKERAAMERHIQSYNTVDIERILNFISQRVLQGVVEATVESLSMVTGTDISETISRQWIARRRLHWISVFIKSQLDTVSSRYRREEDSLGDASPTAHTPIDGLTNLYRKGQFVYVNGWYRPEDARPEYSGIATIDAVRPRKSPTEEIQYDLALEGNKYLREVDEAVLTHPTDDELDNISKRMQIAWKKWKEKDDWVPKYHHMLEILKQMSWEETVGDMIASKGRAPCGKALFDVINQELSEEALFNLAKSKYLTNPFCRSEWCTLSSAVLRKLLRILTMLKLSTKNPDGIRTKFLKTLKRQAKEAASCVRSLADKRQDTVLALAFKTVGADKVYVVAINPELPSSLEGIQLSVERFTSGEGELHIQWYLVTQFIAVVDAIASLVNWVQGAEYSFEDLCESLGVNAVAAQNFLRMARNAKVG